MLHKIHKKFKPSNNAVSINDQNESINNMESSCDVDKFSESDIDDIFILINVYNIWQKKELK